MLVTVTKNGKGQLTPVFHERNTYYVDDNAKPHFLDSSAFFSYIQRDISEKNLKEIDPPEELYYPSPVERIFLPAVNFKLHSKESSMSRLENPYFFLKFPSSLVPPDGISYIPRGVKKYDYEGEIAIVIGKSGKYLSKEEASSILYGYSIVNDLSIRDYQMTEFPRYGKNWVLGKAADYALPYGPYILPKEDVEGFRFRIKTTVNGEIRQDGTTDDMIFTVEELISELSKVTRLRPGDIITTGTPSGVAIHTGTGFLKEGDTVSVEVSGIGKLSTHIMQER